MSDEHQERGLIGLPDPARLWYETEGGQRRVRWDLVDPWLRRINDQGALKVLSDALKIPYSTLAEYRRTSGFQPLPVGRPPTVNLTGWEKEVLLKLRQGVSQAAIAYHRGVSAQAVNGTVRAIAAKQALASKACVYCGGSGVRACGADGEPRCIASWTENKEPVFVPAHSHICTHCGGTSSYTMNMPKETT